MELSRLKSILDEIHRTSIGVIGDFCLDAYWQLDEQPPELSIETGKPTHTVTSQLYSLGGAGNVVSNLAALGAGKITAFGVVGDDLFGREMLRLLNTVCLDTDGIISQAGAWDTPVYAKPYLGSEEQSRIDFGRYNILSQKSASALLKRLEAALPLLDGLIVNQQLAQSIYLPLVIQTINRLAQQYPEKTIMLDARSRVLEFQSMICKINAAEAARLFGAVATTNEAVPLEQAQEYTRNLYGRFRKPIFITRSAHGMLSFDGSEFTELPAIQIDGPTDPVGAGDTTIAALAGALAAGASLQEAGMLANYAAAISVQKLRQTGTASPNEILALVTSRAIPHARQIH